MQAAIAETGRLDAPEVLALLSERCGPYARLAGPWVSFYNPAPPAIWLAGNVSDFVFENLIIMNASVGIRLGVFSNGSRPLVGTPQSNIWFRNVQVTLGPSDAYFIKGPAVDIGYAIWIWFEKCKFEGSPIRYSYQTKTGLTVPWPYSASPDILQLRNTSGTNREAEYWANADVSDPASQIFWKVVDESQSTSTVLSPTRFTKATMAKPDLADGDPLPAGENFHIWVLARVTDVGTQGSLEARARCVVESSAGIQEAKILFGDAKQTKSTTFEWIPLGPLYRPKGSGLEIYAWKEGPGSVQIAGLALAADSTASIILKPLGVYPFYGYWDTPADSPPKLGDSARKHNRRTFRPFYAGVVDPTDPPNRGKGKASSGPGLIKITDCRFNGGGGVRCYGDSSWGFTISDCIFEDDWGSHPNVSPMYVIGASSQGSAFILNSSAADYNLAYADVTIEGTLSDLQGID